MSPRGGRPWLARAARLGLLALVVLGAELPEIHEHGVSTPGLYNEDCPLARLAVPSWGLPALTPPTLPQPDALPDPGPALAFASPSTAVPRAFAPRAPPATA
jgi:hypothetical protein